MVPNRVRVWSNLLKRGLSRELYKGLLQGSLGGILRVRSMVQMVPIQCLKGGTVKTVVFHVYR